MSKHWSLDDIAWVRFDPSKVDPELLAVVKTASLVEANSPDYVVYLRNIFSQDLGFSSAIEEWGAEERQHGEALARWAALADPRFDFEGSLRLVQDEGYKLPLEAEESVRGSQSGELIARCAVESGTTSFYLAMGDCTDEPVLKQIASRIAADEVRHYMLFRDHLVRYEAAGGRLSLRRRLGVMLGRFMEKDDDEFSFAFYAANVAGPEAAPYDRRACGLAYERGALGLYQHQHAATGLKMALKAVGFGTASVTTRLAIKLGWFLLRRRQKQLAACA